MIKQVYNSLAENGHLYDTDLWRQMVSGEVYDAPNPILIEGLNRVKEAQRVYNDLQPTDYETLDRQLRAMIGHVGQGVKVIQPFRFDWGKNISLGDHVFINFNLTILDEAPVTIGHDVFIGPNVSIYTPCHPLDFHERNTGVEWSEPVTIGPNCWIGGSVTILPGVTIGEGCVIGAGSVVTRDLPPHQLCVGNPCRPIRQIRLSTSIE